MPKKGRTKNIKPLNKKIPNYKQPLQHDVEKAQEKPKIKPAEIFEMMGATTKSKKK
jgi:hypothetical protein